ncbi:nod factor hydrolase protein 1-like [Vigna umbellata]|uniref:nod factor hydrolase protein 1-like n=1 Tax=Vigna umbellata TaxID=87088 RepID=UPI001F5E9549|nr:nod factor hydrolase protein 1-like [Vigna umbellata]
MACTNMLRFLFLPMFFVITVKSSTSDIKAIYWLQQPLFPPSAINTSLFTHVYYAFLAPNNATYQLDIPDSTAATLAKFTATLRPSVTTLVSIGGANVKADLFAAIASNAAVRASFINSTIAVARAFGFHGVDIDWEFPRTANEMKDLGQLFKELRAAIVSEASATSRKPLLLTAAVYFSVDYFLSTTTSLRHPVRSINENLDWINVMSYDLNGPWSNRTGPPAGLFDPKSNASVAYGLRSWIRGGVIPKKVVMGLPLYGRTWQLLDPSVHGIGAPAVGAGIGMDGAMALFQVLEFNNETGANVVYDEETASVYSYSGSNWVGYDDPVTVAAKVEFAQSLYLGGYFFWAAGLDTNDWKISTQALNSWMLCINERGRVN